MNSPYADPVRASIYRRVTAQSQFALPASELVDMLQPVGGMRILDVGTGTGIVAECIRRSAGPTAALIGVDAAMAMVGEGRRAFAYPVVVGRLPDLPFPAETFDMAAASFVISHVVNHEEALRDIARVCRSGARIGMTTWGSLPNPAGQLWTDIASRFVPRAELDQAFRTHIPWDEWFSDPRRLAQSLESAGLVGVAVETRTYRMSMPIGDFLISREASIQGAVLRERLSDDEWNDFRQRIGEAFEINFGDVVEYDRDVHLAMGSKD